MKILNIIFPPQCLNCDALVPTHGTLCNGCWQQLHFITEPCCARCGLPFEYEIGEGAECAACIEDAPIYDRARSVLVFDEVSKALVHKLKFQDDTYLARIFAKWMVKQANVLFTDAEIIVPVPLNRWRLASRRYNQSALLAKHIAKLSDKPYMPEWIIRTRRTQPQTGLNKSEREENVRGAFVVPEAAEPALKNASILLVDDVMTTGATIEACAKTLLKGGAKSVNVLTLSRVVRH